MTVTDVILLTFASTVTLILIGIVAYRVIRAGRKYARDLLGAVKDAARAVNQVNGELTYMRQLTQGAVPQQVAETAPPVGTRSRMPEFPQRDVSTYPDAKTEDTDHELLNQTDQELLDAQAREEARSHGIELEDDALPQEAVREEA